MKSNLTKPLLAINKDDEAQNASVATTASPSPIRTGNEAVPVEDQLKVSSHDKRETNGYHDPHPAPPQLETAYDGVLDPSSNYTGFVEVVGKLGCGVLMCRSGSSMKSRFLFRFQ